MMRPGQQQLNQQDLLTDWLWDVRERKKVMDNFIFVATLTGKME